MLVCSAQIHWDQFATIAGEPERKRRTYSLGTLGRDPQLPFPYTQADCSYHSQGLHRCTDHFETENSSLSVIEIPWTTLRRIT